MTPVPSIAAFSPVAFTWTRTLEGFVTCLVVLLHTSGYVGDCPNMQTGFNMRMRTKVRAYERRKNIHDQHAAQVTRNPGLRLPPLCTANVPNRFQMAWRQRQRDLRLLADRALQIYDHTGVVTGRRGLSARVGDWDAKSPIGYWRSDGSMYAGRSAPKPRGNVLGTLSGLLMVASGVGLALYMRNNWHSDTLNAPSKASLERSAQAGSRTLPEQGAHDQAAAVNGAPAMCDDAAQQQQYCHKQLGSLLRLIGIVSVVLSP